MAAQTFWFYDPLNIFLMRPLRPATRGDAASKAFPEYFSPSLEKYAGRSL